MQRNIEILSSSSSTKAKVKAVGELTQFKRDIETFANIDDTDSYDFDINADTVNSTLHELYHKLTSFEINTAEDLQELLIIKRRISKCTEIINNIKPSITMISNDVSVDVTNKIKKKFSLASTNTVVPVKTATLIDWDNLDELYENNKLNEVLDPVVKDQIPTNLFNVKHIHKSCVEIRDCSDVDGEKYVTFTNKSGDSMCKIYIDADSYLIYLFYQYGRQFFCVYYNDDELIVEHPKCRCSIENTDGIYVSTTNKSMLNEIIDSLTTLFE